MLKSSRKDADLKWKRSEHDVSKAEAPVHRTKPYLDPPTKAALVAAVVAGKSQTQVAQEFGVHRNTVQRLCSAVQKVAHPSNPMNPNWRDSARKHAQDAVLNGLKAKRDPYRAANIGLDVLRGLGDLQSGTQVNVDNRSIHVTWGAVQEPQVDAIDTTVSPLESHKET